nr:ORF1 [Torque teno felis virus]
MAYYRRPWYRRRRWRWKKPWYRRGRRFKRRSKVRKRRRRFRRKTKKIVTFWQPPNRVSCTITGWTLGVNAQGTNQGAADAPMRVYKTFIDSDGASTIQYEGGGVNCILFSLQFLWEEYRLWHNTWSESNDGHDLARYFGTTIYLQPHRYVDYIFWWDRDWQRYSNEHFLRCHPCNLFNWKSKRFIRSQSWGQNCKTTKVKIRPPATLTNQWRHMKDWYYTPLFSWGVTVIDWTKFFARGKSIPYCPLPQKEVRVAIIRPEGQIQWQTIDVPNLYYNSYYDRGEGNELWTQLCTKAEALQQNPSTAQDRWKRCTWADNIPYWMAFYGQNKSWDMGNYKLSEWQEGNIDLDENKNRTIWYRIKYPQYTSADASNTDSTTSRNTWIAWKITTSAYNFSIFKLTINLGIAYTGPFVAASYTDQIEIPILYKSKWQWGGQTWSNMEIINPNHFTKSLVSVKNPQTVARSIIYPGDTGAAGLLTDEALARLVEPSTTVDERRPPPWAGLRPEDPYQPDYSESGSEAEESETEQDEKCDEPQALRLLARRLQREQLKRRQLFTFFKSLLKSKRLQERGGQGPPPLWGPPPQTSKYE